MSIDGLHDLIRFLASQARVDQDREDDPRKFEIAGELTESETKEWRLIKVKSTDLEKRRDTLENDLRILSLQKELLWASLRRAHNLIGADCVKVETSNNDKLVLMFTNEKAEV